MPRLIVIRGADEGKQFDLAGPLLAAGRDATLIARSIDLIEETKRLLHWARHFDTPLLGVRPPEKTTRPILLAVTPPSADRGTARGIGR